MNYITLLLMAGVSGVLIIAGIVGFPIYAQTPTELSTFKDPQGKFYLQYPSDWTVQVYISDDNSDNNDGGGAAAADSTTVNNNEKETRWSDIEYLSDADNNTMVDYKNLFGLDIGKVYNPNFVDNADWFLDSSNYEDHVDYYLIPYNYDWQFYSVSFIIAYVVTWFYHSNGSSYALL